MSTLSSKTPGSNATVTLPQLWVLGMRPRTLTMAAVPIMVGSVLAWAGGAAQQWFIFAMTLVCAVLIQIGTNLFNDANDGERGADGPDRIGPLRITGSGLARPKQVRLAALVCFAGALVTGAYLVAVGGMPILMIGLASLVAGYAGRSGRKLLPAERAAAGCYGCAHGHGCRLLRRCRAPREQPARYRGGCAGRPQDAGHTAGRAG